MKQVMQCAMAAQCAKCGSLFDCSYDINEREEERTSRENLKAGKRTKKEGLLCWNCRND